MTNRKRNSRLLGAGSIKTRNHIIARALGRIPRSGPLHDDIRSESAVLIKKLRPVLVGFKFGSVVHALVALAAEYAQELLRAEREGCYCTLDRKNGFFKCPSNRHHAVTEIIFEEEVDAKQ